MLACSRLMIPAVVVFAMTGIASGLSARPARVPPQVAAPVVRVAPLPDTCRRAFVCRQDLFDRNNPNNIRSDLPAPSAQPGQF